MSEHRSEEFLFKVIAIIVIAVTAIIIASMFAPARAHAESDGRAELGSCRIVKARYAKHLYFSIQNGKKILKDAKRLGATQKLLETEKQLHSIEKQMHKATKQQLKNCNTAKQTLKEALKKANETIAGLRKEYDKIQKKSQELNQRLVKQIVLTKKYKRQRWTWALRISGVLMIVAGGAVIAVEAYESARNPNRGLSNPMITGGAGMAIVGAGALTLSFVVD